MPASKNSVKYGPPTFGEEIPSGEWGAAGDVVGVKDAAAAGTAQLFARADHVHAPHADCTDAATIEVSGGKLRAKALGILPSSLGLQVRNETGGVLAAGDIVQATTASAAQGRWLVVKADADLAEKRDLWVCAAAINSGANGTVGKVYTITAVDTSLATTIGDKVFLSTTAGGWTLTAPSAGNSREFPIGWVKVKDAVVGEVAIELSTSAAGVKIANTDIQPGAISADATGRALFAANLFNETTVDAKLADSAINDQKLKSLGTTRKLGGRDEGRACVGYVYLTGVTADTETVVINARTYEFDTNAAITGDVTVDVSADQTADASITALVAAINADASRVVDAVAWTGNSDVSSGCSLVAKAAQATAYTLAETMGNGVRSGATLTGAAVATQRSLWAYEYTVTAADVTTLALAAGNEVVIGAVTSTTQPVLGGLVARTSSGVIKSLATCTVRMAQVNTNFWSLILEDGGAVIASGDVLGFWLGV